MTEDEAKEIGCPLREMRPCEASKCMLWKWKEWDGIPAHHPGDKKEGRCALAITLVDYY